MGESLRIGRGNSLFGYYQDADMDELGELAMPSRNEEQIGTGIDMPTLGEANLAVLHALPAAVRKIDVVQKVL